MSKMGKLGLIAALIFSTFVSISAPQVAHASTSDTDQALMLSASTLGYASSASNITPYSGTQAFTLEAWANSSDACSSSAIVVGFESSYVLFCNGGFWSISQYVSNWNSTSSTLPVRANEWVHLALTRDTSNVWKFYVNGQLNQTGTLASVNGSAGPMIVGALPSRQYWNGMIDEIKYWNVTRTQTQVQSDMNTFGSGGDSGLQYYYNFNDVSGSGVQPTSNLGTAGTNDLTSHSSSGAPTFPDVKISDTTTSPGYTILKFPRTYLNSGGGWRVPSTVSTIAAVVVGGGGGGGMRAGGGGGAGGYVQDTNLSVSPNSFESMTIGQGAPVTGSYTTSSNYRGNSGQDSILGSHYIAKGGGGGGGATDTNDIYRSGVNGGSGGGASGSYTGALVTAPVGTSTQNSYSGNGFGNNGGTGRDDGYWPAGGGGGAGSVGGNGASGGVTGGKGGSGKTDPILGLCLATGGGAGIQSGFTGGPGGDCGGTGNPNSNSGTSGSSTPAPPLTNTGAGGGGSGFGGTDTNGGAGASGVIIIKYKNYFGTSVSLSVNPKKTTKSSASTPITATTTSAGTVTFYANGRVIIGCNGVVVSGTTATCNWRPITQGPVTLTATYTSSDSLYSGSAVAPAYVTTVGKRTTAR